MAGNVARRRDGAWRARYRDARGIEHSQHFDRKLDAQRWLAGIELAQARGEWLDPSLARVRIGVWAQKWLDGQVQLKPSTRARYELAVRRQVLPSWQEVPLAEVTYADVGIWVQQLSASGLAPATVRYAHRVLALILEDAVRDGRLPRNPARGVRLPRVLSNEKTFLTHDQVADLASAAGSYSTLVNVLAYTGLRWGEAAGLTTLECVTQREFVRTRTKTTSVAMQEAGGAAEAFQCLVQRTRKESGAAFPSG